jgi:hypothetical protein
MAFLSLLDDRARPKGSRDPLGFEVVWTEFGRRVVGNLTTITSHWRNFAVGLLGFHWCEQLCREVHPNERLRKVQEHFIRFEQLAGYLRHLAQQKGLGEYPEIMGINRVRKRIAEQPARLALGTGPDGQILSDQISYGLWGLYTTALRESGLLEADEYRTPTDKGRALAECIAEHLDLSWFRDYMAGARKNVRLDELRAMVAPFHEAMSHRNIRDDLIQTLLRGPEGGGCCQRELYQAVKGWKKSELTFEEPATWIGRVLATEGVDPGLHKALEDIQQLERILTTANCLFSYCRRKDGDSLQSVANSIRKAYDFTWIPEGPDLINVYYAEELTRFREALRSRRIEAAIRELLLLNKRVMDGRDGVAWVEEKPEGILKVRVKREITDLPEQDKLKNHWDYNYFLASYARIAELGRAL